VGALANYYILLPFYSTIMPLSAIFSMCAKINPVITDKITYVIFMVVPFNIFKGVIITAVTLLVYKRLAAIIFKNSKS
jgi:riboflavin transporter FmnP